MNRGTGRAVPAELWTKSRRCVRRQFRSGVLYGDNTRDIEEQAFLLATDPGVFGAGACLALISLSTTPMSADEQVRVGIYELYSGTVIVGLVED